MAVEGYGVRRERLPVGERGERRDPRRKEVVAATRHDKARQIADRRDLVGLEERVLRRSKVRGREWSAVEVRLAEDLAAVDPSALDELELQVDG